MNSETLTLTSYPNRLNLKRETNLAGRRENLSPTREKKDRRTGAAARRARQRGHRGQAARRRRAHPLGSAHAGEGAGGGAMDARLAPPLALVWLGSARLRRESKVERRERSRDFEWSRVSSQRTRPRFCSREIDVQPSISIGRLRLHGPAIGPRGRARPCSFGSPGPGCGLGATVLASKQRGRAVLAAGPKEQ